MYWVSGDDSRGTRITSCQQRDENNQTGEFEGRILAKDDGGKVAVDVVSSHCVTTGTSFSV